MPTTEEQNIGANIVYSFYNNVTILKQLAAQQLNLLTPVLSKYEKKEGEKLENLITEQEGLALKNINDQIRGTLQYIFYDYEALASEFKETTLETENIKKTWEEIQYEPHLPREKVNELIREYNRVITKKISQGFFKTAEDVVSQFK